MTGDTNCAACGREAFYLCGSCARAICISHTARGAVGVGIYHPKCGACGSTELTAIRQSGCFITTAVCQVNGYGEDCEPLRILRDFRDTYMQTTPGLRAEVRRYYEVAPAIVSAIQLEPDSEEVLRRIFEKSLAPAVEEIRAGRLSAAHRIYSEMVRRLERRFLADRPH